MDFVYQSRWLKKTVSARLDAFMKRRFDLVHFSLPDVLEYSGEFGNELVLFLPFCNWLSKEGLLKKRYIKTYHGMKCFYDDLDCRGIIEKKATRHFVPLNYRSTWLPVKDEHTFDGLSSASRHLYPDFRARFSQIPLHCDLGLEQEPLLIVHNKFNSEWNGPPVNYISINILDEIFSSLRDSYRIIYIRHGLNALDIGFSSDHNGFFSYGDRDLLRNHSHVMEFDTLFEKHKKSGGTDDINLFKNALYSRCHHFITSQGGGAYQISCFSGSLMIVHHRFGHELGGEYAKGHFTFKTSPPPTLLICRSGDEVLQSLPVLEKPCVIDDRVMIDPRHKNLLERLSPCRDFGNFRAEPLPLETALLAQ
jgi:hypothetical protein